MKTGIWQLLVSIMASSMLTGTGAWLVFGMNTVSKADMVEYVQNQTPWVRDRGLITSDVNKNSKEISHLKDLIEKSALSQNQLVIEQRVLVTKFEDLKEKIDNLIKKLEK